MKTFRFLDWSTIKTFPYLDWSTIKTFPYLDWSHFLSQTSNFITFGSRYKDQLTIKTTFCQSKDGLISEISIVQTELSSLHH